MPNCLARQSITFIESDARLVRDDADVPFSLVGEADVALVKAAETLSGRVLEKCPDITDDKAIALLGPVTQGSTIGQDETYGYWF
jgi:hypothetical protein